METSFTLEILTGFLAAFSFISGIYLTITGKPYHSLWSNLHRISTLILLACYVLLFYPMIRNSDTESFGMIIFITTLTLFFLSLVSGFLVVNVKTKVGWIIWSHRILPMICIITGSIGFWTI